MITRVNSRIFTIFSGISKIFSEHVPEQFAYSFIPDRNRQFQDNLGHHLWDTIGNNPILFPFIMFPTEVFSSQFEISCQYLPINENRRTNRSSHSNNITTLGHRDHKYLWNKSCFLNNKEMGFVCSFELIWAHLTPFELTETSDIRKYKYLENF